MSGEWDWPEVQKGINDAYALVHEFSPLGVEDLLTEQLRAGLEGDTDRSEWVVRRMRHREELSRTLSGLFKLLGDAVADRNREQVDHAVASIRAVAQKSFESGEGGVQR